MSNNPRNMSNNPNCPKRPTTELDFIYEQMTEIKKSVECLSKKIDDLQIRLQEDFNELKEEVVELRPYKTRFDSFVEENIEIRTETEAIRQELSSIKGVFIKSLIGVVSAVGSLLVFFLNFLKQ